MQPGSDEDEQEEPEPPAYPAAGYVSAGNFLPGFGFGTPSKSWLKARGIIKPQFKGGSGTVAGESEPEPMEVEEELKAVPGDKRAKLLRRFDQPPPNPHEEAPVEPPPKKEIKVKHADPKLREMWENRAGVVAEVVRPVMQPPRTEFVGLVRAYESQRGTDIALLLDGDVRVGAHRAVLAARSPFFMQMLTSDFSETTSREVRLGSFSEPAVRAMLEYCYTGRLATTGEFVLELLLLAQFCRVAGLKALIEEYLGKLIDEENVAALCAAAVDCRAWQLREHCVKFLLKHHGKLAKAMREVPRDIVSEVACRTKILASA